VSRSSAILLRAFAVWTVWVWGTRVWNILGEDGRSVGFKVVHVVLALVSVAFAVATWFVVRKERRRHGMLST
jgi:small neutral amino acid transporter SnatA (MarC family)